MTANTGTTATTTTKRYRYLLMVAMPDGGIKRKVMVTPRPLETEDDLASIEKGSPFFENGGSIVAYTLMAVGTNNGSNVYHYKPKL